MISNLATYTKISPNKSSRNGARICKITPHHMAGNLSIETCANVFQNPNRQASSNYGIGSDGRIGCYVDENDRSWCSANYNNDRQAITIEVANDEIGGNWHISDEALESLINLCVDICKRYNFRLDYTGDANGSLTRHNMFINTNCPGSYLQSKFPYIAEEVNRRLDGGQPTPPTPVEGIVAQIQRTLNERYGYNLAIDNSAGPDTRKHLRMAMQHELNVQFGAGLAEDGSFGPATQKALKRVVIEYGCHGNMTWLVQACLYIKGYDPNGLDSNFGPGMKQAVGSFQRNNGLVVDYRVGYNTNMKLFN